MFILVLDSFYRVLQEITDIRGVIFKSGGNPTKIKVSGFANDMAVYLRDCFSIKYVIYILDGLAGVSGLTPNMSKSMVLRLHSSGSALPLDTQGLRCLPSQGLLPVLCVMVGQLDATDEKRTKCIRLLWSRLVLAREKIHTAEQRA